MPGRGGKPLKDCTKTEIRLWIAGLSLCGAGMIAMTFMYWKNGITWHGWFLRILGAYMILGVWYAGLKELHCRKQKTPLPFQRNAEPASAVQGHRPSRSVPIAGLAPDSVVAEQKH